MNLELLLQEAELDIEKPCEPSNPILTKLIIVQHRGFEYIAEDVIVDKENDFIIIRTGKPL